MCHELENTHYHGLVSAADPAGNHGSGGNAASTNADFRGKHGIPFSDPGCGAVCAAVETGLDGRIDVQFFSGARLFRDADVIQALGRGTVEMAVPGTWHVTRYVPDVGVFLLPVFYGGRAEEIYRILEGPAGTELDKRIESTLNVKVIGGWIDLGHAHLFGIHRQIRRHEDIEGLKVRVAGGLANKLRIQGLGGDPVTFPGRICRITSPGTGSMPF
jgi:TRAP-type C4-dicarboxylate transport system substrate-binding protein